MSLRWRMQPSSKSGRHARIALLPFVFLIAFGTVVGVLEILAALRGISFRRAFGSDSLLPLLAALPALMLGFVVGFMAVNALAYLTPLRSVFERECRETGRHGFAAAMKWLGKIGAVFLFLTFAGSMLFILLCP